jgi:hypothetical protein
MLPLPLRLHKALLTAATLAMIVAGAVSDADAQITVPPPGLSEAEFEALIALEIAIDMPALIPPGTRLVDNFCYADSVFGCIGRVDVTITNNPVPGLGNHSVDVGVLTTSVPVDLTLTDITINARVKAVTGIVFTCFIDLDSGTTLVSSDIGLVDLPGFGEVDATQIGGVSAASGGFNDSTNCDGFMGGIIHLLVAEVITEAEDHLDSSLVLHFGATDGSGNTPIASAVEIAYSNAVPGLLAGDFDLDSDVDGADFLKWQRGESFTPYSESDFADWEENFGTVLPAIAAAAASTPEPSSLLLASLAGCALLHRRRRI